MPKSQNPELNTSLENLLLAQEDLSRVKTLLKGNRYETFLYDPVTTLSTEIARQIKLSKRSKEVTKSPIVDPPPKPTNFKDTPSNRVNRIVEEASLEVAEENKLYDVQELQTTGFSSPDNTFTSLTRVDASQKYEELLLEGINPDSIKIVRVK